MLCRTEAEAQEALAEVRHWVEEAGLTRHPEKTRIVILVREHAHSMTELEERLGLPKGKVGNNVKVFEKGAGGNKGTVTFNGQGVKATMPFTLPANGTVIVPFTAKTFGAATLVVHLATVPPHSYTMHFTLSAANDVTQSPCSA